MPLGAICHRIRPLGGSAGDPRGESEVGVRPEVASDAIGFQREMHCGNLHDIGHRFRSVNLT